MNRIQNIKTFLHNYKTLEPWLQDLTKEVHHHYKRELMGGGQMKMNEYLKVSRHPYPAEYVHS